MSERQEKKKRYNLRLMWIADFDKWLNREMPTSCGDCKAFVCYKQWAGDMGDCFCGITKEDAKAKEKNADCPLVPVPPHGRLIDADALFRKVKTECNPYGKPTIEFESGKKVLEMIENAPTIIEAEEGDG